MTPVAKWMNEVETAGKLEFERNYLIDTNLTVADKICNGIGPSWFSADLRERIDAMNSELVIVADNHDLGYWFGTGTQEDFNSLNDAFRVNGHKIADSLYPWWHWRRYYLRHQATAFAKLCDAFGWSAYVNAIKERTNENA